MEELGIQNIDNRTIDEVEVTHAPSSDTDAPIINIKQKTYTIKTNEQVNFLDGVTASDINDGDLTDKIKTNIDILDFSKEGIKKLEYSVSDSAGNTTREIVYVTVKKDNTDIIRLGQFGILIILVVILIFLNKYIRSLKLEKRFSKYTINSSKNKSISLFDNLYIQYVDFLNKIDNILLKSNIFKKLSKRYDKYTVAFDIDSSITFVSKKIIVGFLFVVFEIIVELFQTKLVGSLQMLISFIVGFYALDIIYKYRYFKYKKKISNDMLDAITIMNNAFKSGMSITQSVNLVSREISGPISKEFSKINTDISMGLDIELAFKRFSKRVNSPEAIYLASSLSVLSKTGGNIIKVFNSIEKNMFNRKRLENELKSLTSSSKLIMYVLIIVPPIFMLFINIINKDYFKPLLTNIFGIALLIIICLIYIIYIVVVRKVLRVEGTK